MFVGDGIGENIDRNEKTVVSGECRIMPDRNQDRPFGFLLEDRGLERLCRLSDGKELCEDMLVWCQRWPKKHCCTECEERK